MKRVLVWFKPTDLRLIDHPALAFAHANKNNQVAHVFCLDSTWLCNEVVPLSYFDLKGHVTYGAKNEKVLEDAKEYLPNIRFKKTGSLRMKFMLESVQDLKSQLQSKGSELILRVGNSHEEIASLVEGLKIHQVVSHSEIAYEEIAISKKVKNQVQKLGAEFIELDSHNSIFEKSQLPFTIKNLPDTYTQFRVNVEKACKVTDPLPVPKFQKSIDLEGISLGDVEDISMMVEEKRDLPENANRFTGGESEALKRLEDYFWTSDNVKSYKETRNGLVGMNYSSKFSPWLASGCISPRYILKELKKYESKRVSNESTYWLWFELLWRDYFRFFALKYGNEIYQLGGPQRNIFKKPWISIPSEIEKRFNAWKLGQTGYPFIDSNMRELLNTGFMSNRGRQIVGSFLVNDLQIDWRLGAQHFEEYLLDHDPCSNYGNWTYVAGVGSDPREDRYFNIVKQGTTYDPNAEHIKLWCPELASLNKDVLLDSSKNLTSFVRQMYKIPESVYPAHIAPLKFSKVKTKAPTESKKSREYAKKSQKPWKN